MTLPAWADQYLAHLGLTAEPPTVGLLTRLLHAHLHRVPFENISKLHYAGRIAEHGWKFPPLEVWVERVAGRSFGGTCFTINSALCQLLTELGFEARLMRASGGGHLTVGVKLDGKLCLADAGVGAPLFEPVDLSRSTRVDRFGRGLQIYPMAGEPGAYHLDHYLDGERKMTWTFTSMPEPFEHFAANVDYSYGPSGHFMNFITCSLYQEARHLALRNSALTIRQPDGSKTVRELATVEEIEAVLSEEFGLSGLPVREAAEALAARGIDIFAAAP